MLLMKAYILSGLIFTAAQESPSTCRQQDVPSSKSYCPPGNFTYIDGAGVCLAVHDTHATWQEARQTCRDSAAEADLMTIEDETIDRVLYELTRDCPEELLWIGLHNTEQTNTFVWLDQTTQSPYVGWSAGQPPDDHSDSNVDCVVRSSQSGRWAVESCDTALGFICRVDVRPPQRPALTVELGAPPDTVFLGEPLVASCLVRVALWADVSFRLLPLGRGDTLSDGAALGDKDTLRKEESYLIEDGVCQPYVRGTLTTKVTSNMTGASLSCCGYFQYRYVICSEPRAVRALFKPRPPSLTVSYHRASTLFLVAGLDLDAFCLGHIGDLGHDLAWILSTEMSQTVWRLDRDGALSMAPESRGPVPCARISHKPATRDPDLGPTMRSTFTSLVTEDFEAAVLSCAVLPKSQPYHGRGNTTTDPLISDSIPFQVIYPPEPPELEIRYDVSPDTVLTGSTLLVNCTAQVGTRGHLVWLLHDLKRSRQTRWTVDNTGNVSRVSLRGVTVSAEILDPISERLIRSTMEVEIGLDPDTFQGAIIACFSNDPLERDDNLYDTGSELGQHSFPLRVIYHKLCFYSSDSDGPENVLSFFDSDRVFENKYEPRHRRNDRRQYRLTAESSILVPLDPVSDHWDENPVVEVVFIVGMSLFLGNLMVIWVYIMPGNRRKKSRAKINTKKRMTKKPSDKDGTVTTFQEALFQQSSCVIKAQQSPGEEHAVRRPNSPGIEPK